MTSAELKNKVQEYVDTADVKLLRMIKALVETYHSEDKEAYVSEEQYEIVDRRREAHNKGQSKSLTWEEVKQKARKAKS